VFCRCKFLRPLIQDFYIELLRIKNRTHSLHATALLTPNKMKSHEAEPPVWGKGVAGAAGECLVGWRQNQKATQIVTQKSRFRVRCWHYNLFSKIKKKNSISKIGYTECPPKKRVHSSLIYRRILIIYTPN
jgi:hypothetical protein